MNSKRRRNCVIGIWAGISTFVLSAAFGMSGVISGMQRSMAALARDPDNSTELSKSIGYTLHSQNLFIIGTVLGLLIFAISLICLVRTADARDTTPS